MYEIRNKHTAEKTVKSTDIENVTYTVINYWFKITICSEYRYEPSHWEKKKERKLATVAKQTLVNTGQYFKLNSDIKWSLCCILSHYFPNTKMCIFLLIKVPWHQHSNMLMAILIMWKEKACRMIRETRN